jgi:hypothetical protein
MLTDSQIDLIPILWRRLDRPGLETARLVVLETGWILSGTAVFLDPAGPGRLDYQINLEPGWQTRAARVAGWVGTQTVEIDLRVEQAADGSPLWRLNGAMTPEVTGCVDLDLNFSPSTNLLPVRRLKLAVGQSAQVRAAWLRFPSFTLEPFPQVYTRTGPATYRYQSSGGAFTADLKVNPVGFATHYPPFWEEVR